MKLGRAAKAVDPRTVQYRAVRLEAAWEPPARYSWDEEHPGAVPVPMFLNDQIGDCVIAGRAHHTLRFEFNEQGVAVPITDADVRKEYFLESGGQDSGLVLLYSLRDWRNRGWPAAGKTYRIHSYLEVQPQDHRLVKEAMLVGVGLQFGVNLPLSAADQMNQGAPWDLVAGPRGVAGSWGGHLVHGSEYDDEGVVFETWGKRQKATWRWLDAYCDECYLVIDDVNSLAAGASGTLDVDALTTAVEEAVR